MSPLSWGDPDGGSSTSGTNTAAPGPAEGLVAGSSPIRVPGAGCQRRSDAWPAVLDQRVARWPEPAAAASSEAQAAAVVGIDSQELGVGELER